MSLTATHPDPRTGDVDSEVDVVVIGGGVLGSAIAWRLSQTTARVCLIEREDDLCEGASKGNAGIATTFYAPPGTMEAQLIAESFPRWEDLCDRLDVPFSRTGSLTVALDEDQGKQLPGLLEQALGAGAAGARLVDAAEAREMEPLLSETITGALVLPDEGIIDPVRLVCGYGELAAANGVRVALSCTATGVAVQTGRIAAVHTTRGTVRCRYVVNAAGMAAGTISELSGGEELDPTPRKGQYWILDRAWGARMSKIILPVPMPHTRGVQVVPTTNGSVLLGPSVQDIDDEWDTATSQEALGPIFDQCRALVPSVSLEHAIKTYAANRTVTGEETMRLRVDETMPNLLQVGNRSTGMSCSPAVAEHALALLAEAGLRAPDRPDARRRLYRVPRLLLDQDPERLNALDARYRQVVCVCEDVSAAEIDAALTARVPAVSIEGIRKRTRATGGRCQGSVCMAGVAFMCSLQTGQPPQDIRCGMRGATLGVGHAD
jgi:glycerol-3-phosphate dehydrogenase